jgi:hypothetical protein
MDTDPPHTYSKPFRNLLKIIRNFGEAKDYKE